MGLAGSVAGGKSRQMLVALPDAMSLAGTGSAAIVPTKFAPGLLRLNRLKNSAKGRISQRSPNLNRTRHSQIHLNVRRAAKGIESRGLAVHRDTLAAVRRRDGEGPRGLGLRHRGHFEAAGNVDRPRQHKPVPNIFTRRPVVARGRTGSADRRLHSHSQTARPARIPRSCASRACSARSD